MTVSSFEQNDWNAAMTRELWYQFRLVGIKYPLL